ncbi:MAG: DGQHR domain-containing protein [Polyangiaceae bacterium]
MAVLTLPALKVQQHGRDFYMLNLAAQDVERMVRFEVLGAEGLQGKRGRRAGKTSAVNWEQIEKKVQTSEKAYQRPILRKKIEELTRYYLQCRDDGVMPAIPGAVLLTMEQPVEFEPQGSNPFVGLVRLPADADVLRVLDGQHRLLALAALLKSPAVDEADRAAAQMLQVPAILFTELPPPAVVEMFVTINSKHTRLNASLLFSLKGRQLYSDARDARIHDVVRKLNESDASPLKGQIKMLGVGPGKVAQAGLATEIRAAVDAIEKQHRNAPWLDGFLGHLEKLYVNYFRQIASAFPAAWNSRKHSIQSLISLRAFVRLSVEVFPAVLNHGGSPPALLRQVVEPWGTAVGSARFETAGKWRERAAGGGKETTRRLVQELREHMGTLQ